MVIELDNRLLVVFVSTYLLSNEAVQAGGRFAALARTYDAVSTRALAAAGAGPGLRCWEVGGGGGTIAAWLADQAGPAGSVLVTDIDPSRLGDLARRRNVTICRHDVVRDELPAEGFDLIHARLVLLHLPERRLVLDRLIGCLRPGGRLVIEDFDCEWTPVLAAPDQAAREVFETVHGVFLGLLRDQGADPAWGRELYSELTRHGLSQVSTSTYAVAWPGGGEGIDLHRVNTDQLADRLRSAGVGEKLLARFRALLDDQGFVVQSYPLVTATGTRS